MITATCLLSDEPTGVEFISAVRRREEGVVDGVIVVAASEKRHAVQGVAVPVYHLIV
jgi:hypothetical protein